MLEKLKSYFNEPGDGVFFGFSFGENGSFTYVPGVPASRSHDCYSIAKAFTVTAFGFLVDRGLVNVDDLIFPIMKQYFAPGHDPRWEKVTIAHLMKHRAGIPVPMDIDWQNAAEWGTDYLDYLFSQQLFCEPGADYKYTDAAFYLLSRIFAQISGGKLQDFLARDLLAPLQFREHAFSLCPQGHFMGGTGLYVSTEDMAKLGQLYLNKGTWNGKRLISEAFINTVLDRAFELNPLPNGAVTKGGMYGQLLYINMHTNRVFAVHGYKLDLEKIKAVLIQNDI